MSSETHPKIIDITERKEPQMANGEDQGAPVLSEQEEVELKQLAELILETAVGEELFADLVALSAPILEHARDESPEDDGTWSAGAGWASFPTFSAAEDVLRELLLSDQVDDGSIDSRLREAAESYGVASAAAAPAAESAPAVTDAELGALSEMLADKLQSAPSVEELQTLLGSSTPEFLLEAREQSWDDPAVVESATNYYLAQIDEEALEHVLNSSDELETAESTELADAVSELTSGEVAQALVELIDQRQRREERRRTEAELLALEDPEIIAAHERARNHPELFTPADDLSLEDHSTDTSDEGDWGVAEISVEGEPEAIEDFSLSEAGEHDDHKHHVHQLLSEELRGVDDYDGEPADDRERAVLALIAEGIIYAELSDILFDDLLAEADSIIRKSRILGPDWWMTEEAAAAVADLLSQILIGESWPASGDGRPHQQKLQKFAMSYPLDPEPSRSEKLAALSAGDRYEFLLSERGARNEADLSIGELKVLDHLISEGFDEDPTPKLIKDLGALLDDDSLGAARSLGWIALEGEISRLTFELLTGADVAILPKLSKVDLSELRAKLRTYRDSELTEDEFIAHYDQSRWPSVGATVDLSIFTILDGKLQVLLIERGNHPDKGKWALPGGFVDISESLDQAALRELQEETGVDLSSGGYLEQVRTYGYPGRDRRGYIISTLYAALISDIPAPQAGDDAAKARFFPVDEALGEGFDLAFDHGVLLRDALERVRAKLEYSTIVFDFLPEGGFTIEQLRTVYEIVWGFELTPSAFNRMISSAEGALAISTVEPISFHENSSTAEGLSPGRIGGGAILWSRGKAENFYPPLDRKQLVGG